MRNHFAMDATEELHLTVAPGAVRRWRMALHSGFCFRIPAGLTVRGLLTDELGMDADYVENRVRTVFLGGRPVDDIDAARVHHGAEMTLSTMLPGVAGITMGRGNLIAAYRADITYSEDAAEQDEGRTVIFVKLLNFLAPETGHLFLARGIGLDATAWNRVVPDRDAAFWDGTSRALLGGAVCDPAALAPPAPGVVRYVTIPCAEGDA